MYRKVDISLFVSLCNWIAVCLMWCVAVYATLLQKILVSSLL